MMAREKHDRWWYRLTAGSVVPTARLLETTVPVLDLCSDLDDALLKTCQDEDSTAVHIAAVSSTLAAAPAAAGALFQVGNSLLMQGWRTGHASMHGAIASRCVINITAKAAQHYYCCYCAVG
jgi:hypothetical protein